MTQIRSRPAPAGLPPSSRTWNRPRALAVLALLVVLLGAGAPPAVPPGASAASPMEQPLRLIAEAQQSYQSVRDYTCLFIKRERLRGHLQPESFIAMKLRTQPFSVYLQWVGPKSLVGQAACYVAGRNNGLMRARSTGILGAVGFVSIDPRDPRALESSRHTITEAGLGHLIEQFRKGWEVEYQLNRTQVHVADYEYNKRRCTRVETIHPDNANGYFTFYRSVVYFDQENHLPIRVENYDWPRRGGDPRGEVLENYSYVDLQLNVGLTDQTFNY